jgi:hypothetical protein
MYRVVMGFEGDDTCLKTDVDFLTECDYCLGKSEAYSARCANCFFKRRGFAPKLRQTRTEGYDFARFVGFDVLHHDGVPVYDGGTLVMVPEINRALRTKSWTLTKIPEAERPFCEFINAVSMANENVNFAPMHAFWSAVANNYRGRLKKDLSAEACKVMQDAYMRDSSGGCGSKEDLSAWLDSFELQPVRCTEDAPWMELARVSAGDFTPEEWGTACGVVDIGKHGQDLAVYLPAKWI